MTNPAPAPDATAAALRDSEQRFRAFVTASSDVVYRMSPDWTEMRELDGQGVLVDTPEPIAGWRERYIHPDDLPIVEAAIARAIATKGLFELEHRVRHADGSLGWVLSRAVPILGEDGAITEWLGAGKDVTARKRDEVLLRQRAENRAFLLALGDALRPLADPDEVEHTGCRMLAERLAADRAYYVEVDEAAGTARVRRDFTRGDVRSLRGEHRVADFGWSVAILRRGECHVVGDTRTSEVVPAADRPAAAALGIIACMGAPLIKDGGLVGALCVTVSSPRDWSNGELELLREVGERIWSAVERARAEARTRESEERFRGLVEGLAQAVWETDPEGRVLIESPSWLALTGQAPGTSLGFGWVEAVHSDDRVQAERWWREAVAAERAADIEFRLRVADGGWRWTNARAVLLSDANGRGTKWVGMNIDVSARRAAQEGLRESEERFRQFAECSSDVIWIRDADTLQFEYVSPAIEHIYGVSPETFAARHNDLRAWVEIIHPDDRAGALAAFRRVRAGERVTHEFRIQRPDDGERVIRNTDFPLLDAAGRVQRIAGIGEDVTELRRAEAAIAASELRLRTLTEGIPQLVWRSCDQGRWTWASPQWLAFTGQRQKQTHGWGWLDVIHPDDRAATMQAWEAARPHGMLDVEYRVLRARDHAWIWHHTRSVPVRDADGRITEWLGTSTDIQALRELQERQDVLVGELQHRTRNLIGVVRSIADKSLRASADLADFRDRFGHRMEALSRVQGLLARLSEGERVTFDALLAAELAAMDATDDPRVTLDGPAGVALRSSTVQVLALALHELATNAVKYGALAQSDGRLRVAWRVLPDEGEGARLRIDWRETGVAMPPPGSPPRGTGQGRELIERALPYQLDAETIYVFASGGVECSITISIASPSADAGTMHD